MPHNNDPVAAFDQMMRGMADLTQILYAYFAGCVQAGFTEDQAIRLTAEFQRTLQLMSSEGDDE